MIQQTALHCIAEYPAQTCVDSLNGQLGERFAVYHILFFAQSDVELSEVFRPQLREFVVTYVRKEAIDVTFLTSYSGACELVWRDVLEPVL